MKRQLSLMLIVCMVVSLLAGFSTSVGAETAAAATEMWYCGQKLDAATPYLYAASNGVNPQASATAVDGKKQFAKFENGTLTFTGGFSATTGWNSFIAANSISGKSDQSKYGIYAEGSLTVELGSYKQWIYDTQAEDAMGIGIYVTGDLTINGNDDGYFKVVTTPASNKAADGSGCTAYGIYAGGKVNFNGGSVDIYTPAYLGNATGKDVNSVTMVKADEIVLGGGSLKIRGRSGDNIKNLSLYDATFNIPSEYTQKWSESDSLTGQAILGNESTPTALHSTEQNGDIYAKFVPTYDIEIAGGVTVGNAQKYLVATDSGWAASAESADAVAEYNAATKTLKFLKNATIECISTQGLRYCIKSDGDLTIEIPKGITVTLNGTNTQRNRIIWAQGNITICGEGTLDADTSKDWSGNTDTSGVIWADGGDVVIKDGITAKLHTRDLTESQVAQVIYASGSIKIQECATVIMGTDIGYVAKKAPEIYSGSTVKMAMAATSDGNGATPTSELLPYDASKIAEIKYLIIEPNEISVAGAVLNAKNKYLAVNEGVYSASTESADAVAEFDAATKTLKFLKAAEIDYSTTVMSTVIYSETDLTVDTNGKAVKLSTTPQWSWPTTYGSAIRAEGTVKVIGGGTLDAMMACAGVTGTTQNNVIINDGTYATAVIYGGTGIVLDNVKAVLYLQQEKTNADSTQANVLYSAKVDITENADVRMYKWVSPTVAQENGYPGYLIGGAAAENIKIAGEADAVTGNIKNGWSGLPAESGKIIPYTYNGMKKATYMAVSAMDKTVSIDSMTVNTDNTVSADSNIVKFKASGSDAEAAAPSLMVIAAAYDASGKIVSANTYIGTADGEEHTVNLDGGNSVRVFIWSSIDDIEPLKIVRYYYAAE